MTGRALDSPCWAPVRSRALRRAFGGMRETGDSACALKELAGQRAEPHEPSGGHQAAHRQAHSTRAVSRERRRVNGTGGSVMETFIKEVSVVRAGLWGQALGDRSRMCSLNSLP